MCNCGKKRNEYSNNSSTSNLNTNKSSNESVATVRFEYIGKTALTITGNYSHKQYRFGYPGDKQDIDYFDIKGMLSVPVLKKVDQ